MKKTKITDRFENAYHAFFDDEIENSNENGLIYKSDSALKKQETSERFNEKADVLVKILKRTFLFLPGAFYLFFGTISILEFEFFQFPFTVLTVFLIGSFMTIFGIGSLKNPKHLVIPVSIVAVGIAAFAIFSMFVSLKYVFEYGIYLFPLALIVPFLAKDLVDKTSRENLNLTAREKLL